MDCDIPKGNDILPLKVGISLLDITAYPRGGLSKNDKFLKDRALKDFVTKEFAFINGPHKPANRSGGLFHIC